MKGKLVKKNETWVVKYMSQKFFVTNKKTLGGYKKIWKENELPLHPDDVKQINEDALIFDDIVARINAYPDIEFDFITEPNMFRSSGNIQENYITYAKLK